MRLQDLVKDLPKARLLYLEDAYLREARVKVLRVAFEKKNKAYLVLDATIFHPKSGGQPSDRGLITSPAFKVSVEKAMGADGSVVHFGEILEGKPAETEAQIGIDWPTRYLYMRRHTAGHLLDHCLSEVTGRPVETFDSWLGEPCYVGYRGSPPHRDVIAAAIKMENEMISRDAKVRIETVSRAELAKVAPDAPNIYRLPPLEAYRVVTIEGCKPIPCGGTHLKNIGEIEHIVLNNIEDENTQFKIYYDVQ